ncbi:hypothetical protein RvY_00715 [Ramazzottius varieornatus]|uniref:FERM domain-containing protein n=1 Tax=Ramazzottius varieornatus TaxID=947166 RepID=A0A1D1UJY9_RAMVA|nr:hypothetical protein RvY_00715 [Ramazzottius varieornatus]
MGSQKHTVHVMQTELTKVVKENVERYGLFKISATAVVPVSETNASRGTSGSSGSKSDGSVDIVVRVALLDSRLADFSIPKKSLPQYLLERICTFLHIDHQEYFGLSMPSGSTQTTKWLKPHKPVKSQLKGFESVCFRVKFCPTHPSLLNNSMSRYFIILQTQQDILSGRLPITTQDLIVFAALMVQIHLGSFDPALHLDNYVSTLDILPAKYRTAETERRVMERHRFNLSGLTIAQAEVTYLEHAQGLPLFGVFRFAVKDSNSSMVDLGISARGVSVPEERTHKEVTRYRWNQILEMSCRRSTFCFTVRQVNPANATGPHYTDHKCEFRCKSEQDAKLLWRFAIENHAFFRGRVPLDAEAVQEYKPVKSFSIPRFASFRFHKAKPPTLADNLPKNHAATRRDVPTVATKVFDAKDLENPFTPTITTAPLGFSSFSDNTKPEVKPESQPTNNGGNGVQLRQKPVVVPAAPAVNVSSSKTMSRLSPEGPSEVSTTRNSLLLESSIEAEGEDCFVDAVDDPPPVVTQVYAALANIIDKKNAYREKKRLATQTSAREQQAA